MSDKVASNFSFRMFDLYRRFVEVLQLFPNYLQEFKTGFPKEEICHDIIKKVFKYPQTNDKILHLTKYLSKNSKTIAAHAEDVPVNWKDAIKYTETCIKLVRRYLKKKGIHVMKDDIDSLKDIATEIGECLHINPNEKQIEAIKEFLKHDLDNPKNTIASPVVKKLRNKTDKIIKSTDVVKNANIAEIKRNSLKMVIKRMSGDSTQMQAENSSCDELLSGEVENLTNEKSFTENQKQSYEISLENEFEKKSNQEVTAASDQEQYISYYHSDELDSVRPDDSEDIKYLLSDSMKPYCPEDKYIIIEFNDQTKTSLLQGMEQQSNSSINLMPDKNLNQKRKSSISLNDDSDCIKKLFLSDVSLTDTQNDQYVTLSYNGINEEQNHKTVEGPFMDKADNTYKSDHDTSNSEILIVDDCYDDELTPNENFYNNKQNDNKRSSCEKDVLYNHNESLQDNKEEYIVKDESKYSEVLNMSYAKALELMETILCFCELRNEVSLEEFLVLRRTRDKIHWRSLKEINKDNLLK